MKSKPTVLELLQKQFKEFENSKQRFNSTSLIKYNKF